MEAVHGKERCDTDACIDVIVIGKLYHSKPFNPVILLVVDIDLILL